MHLAVAELARLKDYIPNSKWIAGRTGLSISEVNLILSRLERIGIMRKEAKGYRRIQGRFVSQDKDTTDSALQHLQSKILNRAIDALYEVPLNKRAQESMTIAINSKKIPAAKIMISEFIQNLSNLLESGPLDEVLQISVSMFPLISNAGEKYETNK